MAASFLRTYRLTKVAALTAVGGSLYLFRDDIKSYLNSKSEWTSKEIAKGSCGLSISKPKHIESLPDEIPYLLIGGGTASHASMRAIRGHDPKAKVLIVTSENHSPYMRPALSKELWFTEEGLREKLQFKWWNGKERSIFYELDEFFIPLKDLDKRETGGVSLIKNIRLDRLETENKIAHFENGQIIKYDKCLLAPGGTPKTLPPLESAPLEIRDRIIYFRTADDFLRLNEISKSFKKIAIIGGGFLGSELACALAKRPASDKKNDQVIYQIFPEPGNLGKILPNYLSQWLSKRIEQEGAKIIPSVEVKSVTMTDKKSILIMLSNGESIETDYIVCAIGLEPDVVLAKSSELEVDEKTGGFLVNSELEARSNVWVAGDAACFYDVKLGRRRVEHHDHAINSGRQAGRNMIGDGKAYTHQPMFWSDLGPDLSFEAVGIIDSSLRTVAVFTKEPLAMGLSPSSEDEEVRQKDSKETSQSTSEDDKYSRGIIFYLKDDIVVGVLLWNLFNRLNIARRILHEHKRYEDFNELSKLFNIYLDD